MARLIWIGVGAVGGVYAYRKGEQVVETVREQGVLGTVQLVATAALRAQPAAGERRGVRVGRFRITRADDRAPAPPLGPAAIMETGVIDITDAPTPRRKVR